MTLAGAVAGYETTRPPVTPAVSQQIVVLSADGKGVPLRKPADAAAIAAHDHARGGQARLQENNRAGRGLPDRAPRADPVGGSRGAVSRSRRLGAGGPDRSAPALPQEKRVRAVLPVAAAVAQALAPPRPVDVIFLWLAEKARHRDLDHQHPWVLLMDGQASLWDDAAATLGDTPRLESLDLLHATGYLWVFP